MSTQHGWLKRSLDEATNRVEQWPEWKRSLESAITQNRECRDESTKGAVLENGTSDKAQPK